MPSKLLRNNQVQGRGSLFVDILGVQLGQGDAGSGDVEYEGHRGPRPWPGVGQVHVDDVGRLVVKGPGGTGTGQEAAHGEELLRRQLDLRHDVRKVSTNAEWAQGARPIPQALTGLQLDPEQLGFASIEIGDDIAVGRKISALDGVAELLVEQADAEHLARFPEPLPPQVIVLDGTHRQLGVALDVLIDQGIVGVVGSQLAEAGTGDGLTVIQPDVHVGPHLIDQPDRGQPVRLVDPGAVGELAGDTALNVALGSDLQIRGLTSRATHDSKPVDDGHLQHEIGRRDVAGTIVETVEDLDILSPMEVDPTLGIGGRMGAESGGIEEEVGIALIAASSRVVKAAVRKAPPGKAIEQPEPESSLFRGPTWKREGPIQLRVLIVFLQRPIVPRRIARAGRRVPGVVAGSPGVIVEEPRPRLVLTCPGEGHEPVELQVGGLGNPMLPFQLVGVEIPFSEIEVELPEHSGGIRVLEPAVLDAGVIGPVLVVEEGEPKLVVFDGLIGQVHHARPVHDAQGPGIPIVTLELRPLLIASGDPILVERIVVSVTHAGEIAPLPLEHPARASTSRRKALVQRGRLTVGRELRNTQFAAHAVQRVLPRTRRVVAGNISDQRRRQGSGRRRVDRSLGGDSGRERARAVIRPGPVESSPVVRQKPVVQVGLGIVRGSQDQRYERLFRERLRDDVDPASRVGPGLVRSEGLGDDDLIDDLGGEEIERRGLPVGIG